MGETGIDASGVQIIPLRCGGPLSHRDGWLVGPTEGARRNGLIGAIDAHRIVGRRPSKPVPFDGVGHVGKGAGIDENFPARQFEAAIDAPQRVATLADQQISFCFKSVAIDEDFARH